MHTVTGDPVIPVQTDKPPELPLAVIRYKVQKWFDEGEMKMGPLAMELGVSVHSLRCLGTGYDIAGNYFTFPCMDGKGNWIGARFRSKATGAKWSLSGGRNGLFLPSTFDHRQRWLLVEGPTDCAAALDMGFNAIGRPNNAAGSRYIIELMDGVEVRPVILADNDEAGWDGATRLAKKLPKGALVIAPTHASDIRDYYNRNGSREALLHASLGKANKYWTVEKH